MAKTALIKYTTSPSSPSLVLFSASPPGGRGDPERGRRAAAPAAPDPAPSRLLRRRRKDAQALLHPGLPPAPGGQGRMEGRRSRRRRTGFFLCLSFRFISLETKIEKWILAVVRC